MQPSERRFSRRDAAVDSPNFGREFRVASYVAPIASLRATAVAMVTRRCRQVAQRALRAVEFESNAGMPLQVAEFAS